jgi:acetyl-CoA synthetase
MLSTMPKTRSGKIVRRLLSELVTDGRTTGDITGLEDPEVLDKLKAEITGQS